MTEALAPHLYPAPRLAQGAWLQSKELATAAIDLSDGLSIDSLNAQEQHGWIDGS